MSETYQICDCRRVTNTQIEEAVKNGANTFDKVQAVTHVGTGCGGCIVDAVKVFKDVRAKYIV